MCWWIQLLALRKLLFLVSGQIQSCYNQKLVGSYLLKSGLCSSVKKGIVLLDLILYFVQRETCDLKWLCTQRPEESNIVSIPELKNGDAIADMFIPCVVIAVLNQAEGLNSVEIKHIAHNLRLQQTSLKAIPAQWLTGALPLHRTWPCFYCGNFQTFLKVFLLYLHTWHQIIC